MARIPAMRAPPFSVCSTRFSSVMRPRSARSRVQLPSEDSACSSSSVASSLKIAAMSASNPGSGLGVCTGRRLGSAGCACADGLGRRHAGGSSGSRDAARSARALPPAAAARRTRLDRDLGKFERNGDVTSAATSGAPRHLATLPGQRSARRRPVRLGSGCPARSQAPAPAVRSPASASLAEFRVERRSSACQPAMSASVVREITGVLVDVLDDVLEAVRRCRAAAAALPRGRPWPLSWSLRT